MFFPKYLEEESKEIEEKRDAFERKISEEQERVRKKYDLELNDIAKKLEELKEKKKQYLKDLLEEMIPKGMEICQIKVIENYGFTFQIGNDETYAKISVLPPDDFDDVEDTKYQIKYSIKQISGSFLTQETLDYEQKMDKMILKLKEELENHPKLRLESLYNSELISIQKSNTSVAGLTKEEREVWELYSKGASYAELLNKISGSPTVRIIDNIIQRIRRKFD